MGLALAAGTLLGVLAGSSGHVGLAMVCALGSAVCAGLLGQPARPFLVAATVGCGLGTLAGVVRAPDELPPYAGPERVAVRATLGSDPKTSKAGRYATVHWTGAAGVVRASVAFLPPTPRVGRGDVIELA